MENQSLIYDKKEYDLKKESIELGVALIFAILSSTFTILVVGLVLKGFTEKQFLDQFLFYAPFFGFMLGAVAIKVVEMFSKGKYADIVLHDTKTAPAFLSKVFPFLNNAGILFLVSFTITGWLSFLGAAFNIVFFPIKQTLQAQQLTPFSEFLSYIEPAVTQESWMLFFVIGIELTILLNIFNKLQVKNKTVYSVIAIVLFTIINGYFGRGIHNLRYTADEGSLIYSFFFWGVGTFMTLALGSIIFFWTWHYNNNGFLALKLVYGKDIFLAVSIIGLILITIVTYFAIRYYYKRRKANAFTKHER
jgi:hypothetical protein